jgi:hypothetical protein
MMIEIIQNSKIGPLSILLKNYTLSISDFVYRFFYGRLKSPAIDKVIQKQLKVWHIW